MSVELETRLTLAELSRATGHVEAAREQFSAVESAARAKGFGLIARKASTARG
jgi:hypothetical protein